MKYEIFLKILDTLCKEAPKAYKRYRPGKSDHEKLIRARALAFIHLYLKVKFGLVEFSTREPYITDDTYEPVGLNLGSLSLGELLSFRLLPIAGMQIGSDSFVFL